MIRNDYTFIKLQDILQLIVYVFASDKLINGSGRECMMIVVDITVCRSAHLFVG